MLFMVSNNNLLVQLSICQDKEYRNGLNMGKDDILYTTQSNLYIVIHNNKQGLIN